MYQIINTFQSSAFKTDRTNNHPKIHAYQFTHLRVIKQRINTTGEREGKKNKRRRELQRNQNRKRRNQRPRGSVPISEESRFPRYSARARRLSRFVCARKACTYGLRVCVRTFHYALYDTSLDMRESHLGGCFFHILFFSLASLALFTFLIAVFNSPGESGGGIDCFSLISSHFVNERNFFVCLMV